MGKLGLYIHFPFCKRKCRYCDFYSLTEYGYEKEYVSKLKEEIRYYASTSKRVVDTVYFGGGTPTSLSAGSLSEIFNVISSCFFIEKGAEVTVEANPDTVTSEKIAELRDFATRISVGVQSLDDEVLRFAGRIHTAMQAKRALSQLSRNFDLSADLMLGLPYSGVKKTVNSAKELLELGCVDHLSCYGLKVESGTPFEKEPESVFFSDDDIADEYDEVSRLAGDFGLEMYEVSNFARKGKECRHNIRYWTREDYIGFGPGAHSLIDEVRYFNPRDIRSYLSSPIDGIRQIEEKVSVENAIDETIMLALRMKRGIDLKGFKKRFGFDFEDKYADQLKRLEPYLEKERGFLSIKEKNFYAMNSIIVEFLS